MTAVRPGHDGQLLVSPAGVARVDGQLGQPGQLARPLVLRGHGIVPESLAEGAPLRRANPLGVPSLGLQPGSVWCVVHRLVQPGHGIEVRLGHRPGPVQQGVVG